MDNQEKLGFEAVTEQTMLCKDCIWRGELLGLKPTQCEMYPTGKPLKVIARAKDAECVDYNAD